MKKSRFTNNLGFTLVEMLVVLTVLAIVLGASMWATTGWIHHFTYMQNEEKARYIYLGAQSGLSAYSGRGTLGELFEDIDDLETTGELVYITPENKEALGLPIEHDNRDQDHEYAYLSVPAGKLDSNVTYSNGDNSATMKKSETFLYKLVSPYMSDAKSIEGSIVIELDMTSQKVYSVFYSSWADEFLYGTSDSVVRGTFYINKDSRTKDARYDHCVGYYGSDQVNVINLTLPNGIKVEKALLVNEETLHLDFYSDAENLENYTMFNITFYAKGENGNADEKLFTVEVDPSDTAILGPMAQGTKIDPKPVMLKTTLADGTVANLPFFLGYLPDPNDPDERYSLSLTVDAMMDSQSMALLNKAVDGKTDTKGLSITRFAGDKAKLIYADIEVSANAAGAGVLSAGAGQGLTSNIENDLYATEKDVMNEPVAIDDSHNIIYWRHLSNVRYGETYYERESSDTARSYNMTTDLQWSTAKEYAFSGTSSTIDELSGDKKIWPSIPSLGNKATLNAIDTVNPNNNYALFGVRMDNTSYITYDYAADGKPDVTAGNKASEIGFVANNHGTISGLSLYDTSLYAYTNDQAKTAGKENSNGSSIYSDTLRAAGLLTGRNDGILSEIYIDKDSLVDATVTMDNSVSYTNGCGVGILSGTISLRNGYPIDRVYINGSLKGDIAGAANTPAVSDTAGRKAIYSTPANASRYAYGVGAVSGYVYGDYNAGDEIGIGITKAANYHNIKLKKLEAGQITDDTGYVFDGWTDNGISVINKAPVTSTVSFAGGIAGNIYIAHLNNGSVGSTTDEGDWSIPSIAEPQVVNCRNYGDVEGKDFVGGILGVNGNNGYILECTSYGGTKATSGVSAGIASENFGFIEKCSLDRALGDASHPDAYVPTINGNMDVAGAITCINHEQCVVKDCSTAASNFDSLNDDILISGNYMGTFGYLVGDNEGVVNGGIVGRHVGYNSKKRNLIIGGAVGNNKAGAVVKHVNGAMDLKDNGQASYIGGIVGNNRGIVKLSFFSGSIEKKRNEIPKMAIGGIVAQNMGSGKVTDCYLVGGRINVTGFCSYAEDDSETTKLNKSSYVGGICGINNNGSSIENCYVTALSKEDGSISRQSDVLVQKGMVGGIAAVNSGTIRHCGYTDKVFVNDTDQTNLTYGYPVVKSGSTDMALLETAKPYIEKAMNSNDYDAISKLNSLFKVTDVDNRSPEDFSANKAEGDMTVAALKVMGDLPRIGTEDPNQPRYAWSRSQYGNNYDSTSNQFIVTLGRFNDKADCNGYVGGIAGFNTSKASLTECASGKWIVENYLPTSRDAAVGGIVGENASDGNFRYNINFAYVRRELYQPAFTDADYNQKTNTKLTGAGFHRFHYVGGVTGVQNNTTSDKWVVEGCINVGTVINYYGNDVGGVISKLIHNCGTVRYCYNYGLLMTGAEFNDYDGKAGWCGNAGGVVDHIVRMYPNQTCNVISCQNHGIVNFPMQEVDFRTNMVHKYINNPSGRISLANDAGGVVGVISAASNTDSHILNVIDCVNGTTARVYGESQGGGILGQVGGKTNENDKGNNQSDNVLVNVESCRNYSSYLLTGNQNKDNYSLLTDRPHYMGGIIGNRDPYVSPSTATGYTVMQNCMTLRMYRFENNNTYTITNNNAICNKTTNRYTTNNLLRIYSNNFHIDEITYHYTQTNGKIAEDGSIVAATGYNPNNWSNSYSDYTCAKISTSKPSVVTEVRKGNGAKIRLDEECKRVGLSRLQAVTYGDGYYGMVAIRSEEYYGYSSNKLNDILNVNSAWVETVNGNKVVKVVDNTTHEEVIYGDIIYEFKEKTPMAGRSYTGRDTGTISFYNYVLNRTDNYHSGNAYGSRIPTADEFDMDMEAFDRAFVAYIARLKSEKTPDNVINVNVVKTTDSATGAMIVDGKYKITWDVVDANGNPGTANEFEMLTSIYRVPAGTDFTTCIAASDKEITDVAEKLEFDEESKVVGRNGSYVTPDTLQFDAEYDYYVVVRVRDSLSNTPDDYSDIMHTDSIKSYIKLEPKLPTPELEIVEYGVHWYLHLLNPEDYVDYVKLPNFKIPVMLYKTNNTWEDPNIAITADNISSAFGGNDDATKLLTNAVIIPDDSIIVGATATNNRATASGVISLRGIAKADGCLDSDVKIMNIFLPKVTTANTALSEVTDNLNVIAGKPEYEATFTYNGLEGVTTYMPQVFRLELYGEKTLADGVTKVHETIAHKDYSLSKGESTEISIGYYDAAADVDLSVYDSFYTEIWYVSPGLGDVYTYIHTDAAHASDKKRVTGFITDYNDGMADVDYLFRTVKLPTPVIEPVFVGFTPESATSTKPVANWGIRLLNYKDYDLLNDVTLNVGLGRDVNKTPAPAYYFGVNDALHNTAGTTIYPSGYYFAQTDGEQWRARLNAFASEEGYINSDIYEALGLSWRIPKVLDKDKYILTTFKSFASEDYNDGTGVITGEFSYTGTTLTYKGVLSYNEANTTSAESYYKVELYAYDENNNPVTLYLSDDKLMTNTSNNTSVISKDQISISLANNEKLDLRKYHDFHVAAWYSANCYNSNQPTRIQSDKRIKTYFETVESLVPATGYREQGFIKYLDSTTGKYKYYYSAVVATRDVCENNASLRIYIENSTSVKSFDNTAALTANGAIVSWTKYDTAQAADKYTVEQSVYALPLGTTVADLTELDEASKIGTVYVDVEGNSFRSSADVFEAGMAASTPVTLDFDANTYYSVVRVKDVGTTDDYYSPKILAEVAKKLPTPIIAITTDNFAGKPNWYIYIVNWEEFIGTGAIIHILNNGSPYIAPGSSTPLVINTSQPQSIASGAIPLVANINDYSRNKRRFSAYASLGGFDTDVFVFNDYVGQDINTPWFPNNMSSDYRFSINTLNHNTSDVTISSNSINYTGTYKYSSNNRTYTYYVIEVYGYKPNDTTPYTLYMSDEQRVNALSKSDVSAGLNFTANMDASINLDDYSDIRVALWMSKGEAYQDSPAYDPDAWFIYKHPISDEVAANLGYSRVNGVITDYSHFSTEGIKYWYVPSIANGNISIDGYTFMTEDVIKRQGMLMAPRPNTNSMVPNLTAGAGNVVEPTLVPDNANQNSESTDNNDSNDDSNATNSEETNNNQINNAPEVDSNNTDAQNVDNSSETQNADNTDDAGDVNPEEVHDDNATDSASGDNNTEPESTPENPAIVPDTQNLGGNESANTDNTAGDSTQATDTQNTDTQNTDSQATDNNDNGGDNSVNGN